MNGISLDLLPFFNSPAAILSPPSCYSKFSWFQVDLLPQSSCLSLRIQEEGEQISSSCSQWGLAIACRDCGPKAWVPVCSCCGLSSGLSSGCFGKSAVLSPGCALFKIKISSFIGYVGEGNGNPLQYSCLENPMDGGAWWATVYGVAQAIQHRLYNCP